MPARRPAVRPAAAPVLALALALAGCGLTAPYEYRADAVDRASPTFNREPEPFTRVAFCSVGYRSSLDTLTAMAETRCAAHGRTAKFRAFSLDSCPLLTPVLAEFDCLPR